MNRREFLKISTMTMVALMVVRFPDNSTFFTDQAQISDQIVELGSKLYKTTNNGRILTSSNGGISWQRAANFGSEFDIRALSVVDRKLVAKIGFAGGEFELTSVNGTMWRAIA
jgi:hypothetical protein